MGQISSSISRIAPVLGSVSSVLGGISPIVGAISQFGSLASGGADDLGKDLYLAQQKTALKQLQQSQNLQMQDLEEQAVLSRAKIQSDASADEQSRLAALRRAVARQKVTYGANGISIDDSSPQAVLLGMYNESDEEKAQREQQDNIRNTVLGQGLAAQQRANILETAQLREKQNLARIGEGY